MSIWASQDYSRDFRLLVLLLNRLEKRKTVWKHNHSKLPGYISAMWIGLLQMSICLKLLPEYNNWSDLATFIE